MKHVKRVGIVINAKAILVALLAVTSMMVCRHFGLSADFPLTLIATAVVFPIVFSINSAYKRREAALAAYGGVKAHGRAIYFAARDWLADDDPETVDRISRLLGGLLSDCRTLFSTPVNAMQAEVEASRLERAAAAAPRRFAVDRRHLSRRVSGLCLSLRRRQIPHGRRPRRRGPRLRRRPAPLRGPPFLSASRC